MKQFLFLFFLCPVLLLANSENHQGRKKESSVARVHFFSEGNKKEILINGKALTQLKTQSFSEGIYLLESKQAELKIRIDNSVKIKMGENSKIQIEITKSSRGILNHLYGKVQIVVSSANILSYQIENLFSFALDSGELLAEHDFKDKRSQFSSLKGEQKIQIIGDDRIHSLKEGQFLEFTPEWNDGEMVYDFLLNNKKIPKFHISQGAIQRDVKKLELEWKFVEISSKSKKKVINEEINEDQLKQKVKGLQDGKQICKQPRAAFSECVWVKENKKCVRYTCNLNGEWAQRTEFSLAAECPDKKTIKSCEWLR